MQFRTLRLSAQRNLASRERLCSEIGIDLSAFPTVAQPISNFVSARWKNTGYGSILCGMPKFRAKAGSPRSASFAFVRLRGDWRPLLRRPAVRAFNEEPERLVQRVDSRIIVPNA